MIRFVSALFLIVFIQILFVGCKSTANKMDLFVQAYNASVKPSSVLHSSNAEALYDKKIIKIKIVLNYNLEEIKNVNIDKLLPKLFIQLLGGEDSARELINEEGVNFEVSFFTRMSLELSTVIIDKKKLAEFGQDSRSKITTFDLPKDLGNTTNSGIRSMLATLNQNLPIRDKNTGFFILKIDINPASELIYSVRVPNNLASKIKGRDAAEVLKDDILRTGKSKQLFESIRDFGITTIKYKYEDEQGKNLNEVVILGKEFN